MTDWKLLKENLKYQDGRFKIYENQVLSPEGKILDLRKIKIKPGAHFVGITKNGKIPLIRQYRYPAGQNFLEIPSGGVDIEKESFKEAAIREFEEEVGYHPKNVQFVTKYYHSPSLDWVYEIYFSNNLEKIKTNHEESEYGSEVVLLTYNECMEEINNGGINDSTTIACLTTCKEKGFIQ